MTLAEADEIFGLPTIFPNYVVRALEKPDGLHVHCHRRNADGFEVLPNGYMLGMNALHFKPWAA